MFGRKKTNNEDDLDLNLDALDNVDPETEDEKKIHPLTIASVVVLCLIIVTAGVLWKEVSSFNAADSSTTTTAEAETEITETVTPTPTEEVVETEEDEDWQLILVNKDNPIPDDYEIPELTDLKNGQKVDSRIYPDLQEMFDAAKADGVTPYITSSYRSRSEQQEQMDEKIQEFVDEGMSQEDAEEEAKNWVSEPGTSEHELGLAIDVSSENKEEQEPSVVWDWLSQNSYKYGFILRYPEGKSDITGIDTELWHYRYVGVEAATEIYNKDITLEEYLDPSLIVTSDESDDDDENDADEDTYNDTSDDNDDSDSDDISSDDGYTDDTDGDNEYDNDYGEYNGDDSYDDNDDSGDDFGDDNFDYEEYDYRSDDGEGDYYYYDDDSHIAD